MKTNEICVILVFYVILNYPHDCDCELQHQVVTNCIIDKCDCIKSSHENCYEIYCSKKMNNSLLSFSVSGDSSNYCLWSFRNAKIQKINDQQFEDLNIKTLDLSHNLIENLPTNVFYDMTQLQVLHLSDNKISKLSSKVFEPVKMTLEWLFVDSNLLTSEPELSQAKVLTLLSLKNNSIKNFFSDTPFPSSLQKLYLNSNQLNQLHKGFQNLENLEVLDLSYNVISFIDANAFRSLKNLRYLYLSHNRLLRISSEWVFKLNKLALIKMDNQFGSIEKADEIKFHNELVLFDISNNSFRNIDPCIFKGNYKRDQLYKIEISNDNYIEKMCNCETISYFLRNDINIELVCEYQNKAKVFNEDNCVISKVSVNICEKKDATNNPGPLNVFVIVISSLVIFILLVIMIPIIYILHKKKRLCERNFDGCSCCKSIPSLNCSMLYFFKPKVRAVNIGMNNNLEHYINDKSNEEYYEAIVIPENIK